MFFQVDITPKEKKARAPASQKTAESTNYSLLLAPFQPPTRIKLDARINTSTECQLTLKNSNQRTLTVSIVKSPPQERRITFSDTQWTIQPESYVILDIVWQPQEAGNWRDTLQLSDSRHIKYDIPLILSCTDPHKKAIKRDGRPKKTLPLSSKINSLQNIQRNSKILQKVNDYNRPSESKVQAELKRNRSVINECADKENFSNNANANWMLEQARNKKQKKEQAPATSLDFSEFLNLSSFKFTPIKSKFTGFGSSVAEDAVSPKNNIEKVNETWLLRQDPTSLTVESKVEITTLRKETYITVPKFLNIQDLENDNQFDDSLSPKTPDVKKPQSEFSKLFDDIKFTPLKCSSTESNFSPNHCSTATKPKTNLPDDTPDSSVKNRTFDIENPEANVTYELPASPTTAKNQIKPTCLAKSFGKSVDVDFLSPLPIKNSINATIHDLSRFSNQFSRSQADFGSAKDCLEADLWVKSKNMSLSPVSKNMMHSTLDSIAEEDVKHLNGIEDNEDIYLTEYYKKQLQRQAVCIEISPPKYMKKKSPMRRVSPAKKSKIMREKCIIDAVKARKRQINESIKNNKSIDIPGVQIAKLSFKDLPKDKNVSKTVQKQPKEVSVKLHDPNDFLSMFCNPDPFAPTTTCDPFLASTIYYDERWIFVQEIEFKKWLNKLLTPPEQLTTDIDSAIIDIGKVWQSCRAKEDVALAETKETVSARYHTNMRLNTLRKSACAMYRSIPVMNVLSKLMIGIEKEILIIRTDKDLHRDIGLQKIILELFISYNPLWLRIGLETIYGETIPLQSNNDIIGLSRFLLNRFFSDPFIVKKHSFQAHPNIRLKSFQAVMNKSILKRFLFLVYFLDHAKKNKLIGHDPCLFHKKATFKDSREILLTFSRELLSGIGDITKVLRNYSYEVSHKQSYLDEFDYAVESLGADLRDGIRLCRVMELMTGKKNLTSQCQVPAISRLRKVHNVKVALAAIKEAGYTITGGIDANSIADGHREKTLSLLWQLINKFRAPVYDKAAKTLQNWWRSKLWYVKLKNLVRKRKYDAASVIQRAWRCYVAKQKLSSLKVKYARELQVKTEAVRKIQLRWRLKKEAEKQQKEYRRVIQSAVKIQKWWRRKHTSEPYVREFRRQRELVIKSQRLWRAKQLMKAERHVFVQLKTSAVKIQRRWRARRLGQQVLQSYQNDRKAIIWAQRKWRSTLLMKKERSAYLRTVEAVRDVQEWWRRCQIAKKDRNNFLAMKNAVRIIEKAWIARHTETEERKHFLVTKNSIVVIQRSWRHYRATRQDVLSYKNKKQACVKIQSWWRSVVAVKSYQKQLSSCIKIQRWYGSIVSGRNSRSRYLTLKLAAIMIQKNWKMILARRDYRNKKTSALKIASWYRNLVAGRAVRQQYLRTKSAVKTIEDYYLLLKNTRQTRTRFVEMRMAAVIIQQRWRAQLSMRECRQSFLRTKTCVVKLQARWRMILARKHYLRIKAVVMIQSCWRMILARKRYLRIKAAVMIQSCWRMVLATRRYKKLVERKNAAIVLQHRWRALKCGREARANFARQVNCVILIQRKWRETLLARSERSKFLLKRRSAIVVQTHWRKFVAARNFKKMKSAVLAIEKWRKHVLNGRQVRAEYLKLKMTVARMQQFVRTKQQVKEFRRCRNAVIEIQRFWKSTLKMRECKAEYERQKAAALVLQRRYRARQIALRVRRDYQHQIASTLAIQRWWRNILNERRLKIERERQKLAVRVIENWWTTMSEQRRLREIERAQLTREYRACVRIQAAWRGFKVRQAACKKMSILRERARIASKAAVPSATLASRLQENIEMFRYASNIGQLSICLSSLDVITRLSPNACVNVCQLNLVSRLYDILDRANRSLPWLDICTKDISILLTLAKFKPTKSYVLKEEYIEVLVKLLTISVDKKEELFLLTATLLWVLTEDEDYAEAVQQCSRTKYLLSSLYTSINKKLTKSTSSIAKCKEQNSLPSPKPDWGLNHKRPRTFGSISHAIHSISLRLKILNITPQVANNSHRSFNFSMS